LRASAACADVYGLELIAEGIQNNSSNKTRFYVLSMNEPSTAQADRLAFIVSGDADALPDLMAEMEKRDMTLIALHDRPLKTELGEYFYLIECTGSYQSYEALTKEADFTFRFLGSFPVR
jgi:prephenate dehydratase